MKLLEKFSHYLDRVSGYADRVLSLVCIMIYSVIVVLVFIGTTSRYAFNHPFTFTEEISTMLMISMAFLGASLPFRREQHPRLVLVVEKFPKKVQKLINVFIILFCIYILFRLIPHAYSFLWTIGKGQTLATLEISMIVFYIPLALGLSVLLFEFVNLLVKKIIGNKQREDPHSALRQ